jgi:alkanesulfonate monooxygenase SsuD/methylene tetrahydromethanopterin reductase-like flavin-dependent oxidoreductase (luciferase family)
MDGTRVRIAYNPGTLLSADEVLKFATMADRAQNIDSLWIPESWGREAFTMLGAISQITKKVRLGTSIISIYARTPATVAMAATTLDMLSHNRTIIGLGASTSTIVQDWHGVPFQKPLQRMEEYVQFLRHMISGRKISLQGKFFKINDFKILYTPQRTKIPIFIAAVNNKMISLAGSVGDGVILYLRPLQELKKTVDGLRSILKQQERENNFEIASVFITAISNSDPEKARQRAAKTLAFYIAVGKFYQTFLYNNGYAHEVEQLIAEYKRNGLDLASKNISEKMLNDLTISGSSEDCIKSLKRVMETGITLPILQINPVGKAQDSFRELLSTF